MVARLPATPQADQDTPPSLAALLAGRACPPDEDLRRLLMAIRRANVIENRAIEEYLGLGPARSERGRTAGQGRRQGGQGYAG